MRPPDSPQYRWRQKLWKKAWHLLLMCGFGSVCLALAVVAWNPPRTSQTDEKSVSFPEHRSLSNWQFVDSAPLTDVAKKRLKGYQYRYQRGDSNLDVELWHGPNGLVCRGLFNTPISEHIANLPPSLPTIQQVESEAEEKTGDKQELRALKPVTYERNEGSYLFLPLLEGAHLSSIIDSRGTSIVEHRQFVHNRFRYFLYPKAMLRWLLGRESIAGDHECIKVALSINMSANASPNRQALLEAVWRDWYQWGKEQI